MREEQDFLDWTQEQDDRLRTALGALRDDVDAAGIPDVRFVMQRAGRQRHRALAGVAAGAAAVLGLSWLGYQALDEGATTAPPAGTSTPSEEVTEQVTDDATGTAVDAAPVRADELVLAEDGGPDLNLFVPPSLWASEAFTDGAATAAGQGEFESTALIDCDPDDVLWGTEDEGTFGVLGVWSDGSAFATQRVRLLPSPDEAATYTAELDEALAGCQAPAGADNIDYEVEPLDLAGGYRITTTFRDGTEPLTSFYRVVQHTGTPAAVSTFRITDWSDTATDAQAVTELERLAALVTGN